MVQLDIPAAFAVSFLFVDLARQRIKREAEASGGKRPLIYWRYLFYSVFFSAVVIVPAGLYLICGWPGWEQIYWSKRFEELIHTGWLNPLFPTLFVVGIVLAAYLGFCLAYHWVTTGKERYLKPTYIGVLLLSALVVALCYPSFLLVGTYNQYHNLNNQTRESMAKVWENPFDFGIAWIGVMVYFTLCLIYTIVKIRKENKGGSSGNCVET
ncbi:hypothetical protein KJ640_07460 [bacterium]|nr:hypothetical protein [bacterium]